MRLLAEVSGHVHPMRDRRVRGHVLETDGVVLDGVSTVDQSLLTGESRSVAAGPGDRVHAGTVNVGARLRVRVDAVGDQTRVGKLMRLVEECSQRRAPIVQFADRVAEQCGELLDQLPDESLRKVALWKLEGFSRREIADRLERLFNGDSDR